jgi:sporadic carbohydrate cluster protein (TIGR04323 family)
MKLKGYIFSRKFFDERVPQHIQNIILRDYCQKRNVNFLMSSTEYNIEGSSYILFEILNNLKKKDGIIFYSLFQLPENRNLRVKIYKKVLSNQNQLHFAVENICAKSKSDFQNIEKIFTLKQSLNIKKKYKPGKNLKLVSIKHDKNKRNYLERMINDKVHCMKVAKQYEKRYWDGDRKYGYGGYKYIEGYHTNLAKKLIKLYSLNNSSKILDVGCGKGYLLYEIKKILKNIKIIGLDISNYAIKNSKKEIKKNILYHDLNNKLNFKDKSFDLVLSIMSLHNLKIKNIHERLKDIERIGNAKFICVESYRNEQEQFNLQCWALTAETLIDVNAWKWLFKSSNYTGDYEFIYFK